MAKTNDPGLGTKFSQPVKRLLNPDGSYNIIRKGGVTGFQDFYKHLIDKSRGEFSLILIGTFLSINLFFALIYLLIGVDQLSNVSSDFHPFWTAFFFSSQTLTTVGFGYVAPVGFVANIVAVIEAFIGLSITALATGLLYGRFSKPNLKISFSEKILLAPYQDGKAMMFKLVNKRNNVLMKSKVSCILSMDKGMGENTYNKDFYQLPLEVETILFFPLTWTIVHKIDENSPFFGISREELMLRNAELVVLFETFDETFSQNIVQKHSYAGDQWLENVKFDMNFHPNSQGQLELDVNSLNNLIEIKNN